MRRRRSLRHRMNTRLLARVLAGVVLAMLVVALVPPLRRAAALATSRAVLFAASPLAPRIDDFERLPETTKVVAADGTVVAELDKAQHREPVKLRELPPHVRNAVLAAEDEEFYHHSGIDPSALLRAFAHTATGRTQGGSTITQQLAKINYTAGERTVLRKLKEVLYATKLERRYSKDTLLQRYLNQVYFGGGAYGIEAAAQTYFGVPAKDLTPAQAALLAGKIRSPESLDPRKRPDAVKERRDQVLANMHQQGWLKDADYKAAVASAVELAPPPAAATDARAPHFVEYVKREAKGIDALGGSADTRSSRLFTGGYTVETTLDLKVLDATVAAVRDKLGQPGDPVTAAATVAPGDGAIRSLFGGLDFASTQFDMSSVGGRQAGSSFKPFVYLTALREGIDPRSTFDGTSGRVVPCYRKEPVNNYAGEDMGGKITIDEALIHSVNVVFAELGCQVGAKDVLRTAIDDGIPEDADTGHGAVFLGGLDGKGVNALEMASAFATFAAKGTYAQPYAIARIKDDRGHVVYEHHVTSRQVFTPEQVGVLNNPLQGVVQRGTGVAADIGRPVAGKTGTTQDNVDAWFIGFTPQLATGVWVGYPEGNKRPMQNVHGRAVTGGSFPAAIFSSLMRVALEGVPVEPIFTASPDQLQLHRVGDTTTVPASASSTVPGMTTTTSFVDGSTTSTPPGGGGGGGGATTTTGAPGQQTTTTKPPKHPPSTTTSTSPPPTTSTTVSSSGQTTTTTTPR
jgi:penicillin-binding protein 1A